MHIISVKTLKDYWESPGNGNAQGPLSAWHTLVKSLNWKTPADVKATFAHASIRPSGRVVFNCGGNNYRIVAGINYAVGVVYIKFVGNHTEYDAIDVDTVDHSKQ